MNILPSIYRESVHFFEQSFLSKLSAQQKRVGAIALIALSIFAAACYAVYRYYSGISRPKWVDRPIEKPQDIPQIPDVARVHYQHGIEVFSFNVLQRRIVDSKEDNQLISPLGISFLLSMIKHGVGPEDQAEIERIGRLPSSETALRVSAFELIEKLKKKGLDIAGLLYLNPKYRLDSVYQSLTSQYYQSKIEVGTSVDPINKWVQTITHGQIKEILNQADLNDFFVVLANAMYFKGQWMEAFKPENTVLENFVAPTKTIQVQMMHKTDDVQYFEDADCQAIKLSYQDKQAFSLLLVLPKQQNDFSFVDADKFVAISRGLSSETVKIALPKFKLEQEVDVKALLEDMGMDHLFKKADFTPLVDKAHAPSKEALPDLRISKMKQKSTLECDEEGTVAATVTAAVVVKECCIAPREPKEICFDRPFLAALVTDEAPVLFGVVRDPSSAK